MKFGVREICDVVLRAKAAQKIGNRIFYKNEPVLYFDSLKTSTLEGAATTVYAQGGRGNARLVAWEGERTVTFTMEDALISPEGFSILTGAGLVQAEEKPVIVHRMEQTNKVRVDEDGIVYITLKETPYLGTHRREEVKPGGNQILEDSREDFIYVMPLDENGEIYTEPYIGCETDASFEEGSNVIQVVPEEQTPYLSDTNENGLGYRINDTNKFTNDCVVLVDYYVKKDSGAFQIDITPDKFGGNFYLEASTLFRSTNGVDMPAQFVIPNCKIQSNFTFTMASSGDPSTFTFTMDAFPDYTRWDPTQKVFATIQVIEQDSIFSSLERLGTAHDYENEDLEPGRTYRNVQQEKIEGTSIPLELTNPILSSTTAPSQSSGTVTYFNDGLGYIKGHSLANSGGEVTEETPKVSDEAKNKLNEYTTTGYIQYYPGQEITVTGFKSNSKSDIGNNNVNALCQGVFFYGTKINEGIYDTQCLGRKKLNTSGSFITNFNSNALQHLPGDNSNEFLDSYAPEDFGANSDYIYYFIRVCYHNTDLRDMQITLEEVPESSQNPVPIDGKRKSSPSKSNIRVTEKVVIVDKEDWDGYNDKPLPVEEDDFIIDDDDER